MFFEGVVCSICYVVVQVSEGCAILCVFELWYDSVMSLFLVVLLVCVCVILLSMVFNISGWYMFSSAMYLMVLSSLLSCVFMGMLMSL